MAQEEHRKVIENKPVAFSSRVSEESYLHQIEVVLELGDQITLSFEEPDIL
jgi:hypothetical protein